MIRNRYIGFIVLLILASYSLQGQEATFSEITDIDSLEKLLAEKEHVDIEKVILLNELARQYFFINRNLDGLKATVKAKEISDELDFDGGRVMYYQTLSAFHGDFYDELYIYYQKQAQWLSNSLGNRLINYYIDLEIPETNSNKGFSDLLVDFEELLSEVEDISNSEIEANVLAYTAFFNFQLGNHERAFNQYNKAIRIYSVLGHTYLVFLASTSKMNFLRNLGRDDEAKIIELELVRSFVGNKDENAIGLIANTLASGYANSGRYLLAIEYYLKAIETFESLEDYKMIGKAYFDMGVAYENLNLNSKAYGSYLKAIPNLKMIQDSANVRMVYGAMVFPLIAMGKYDEARTYMQVELQDTVVDFRKNFLLARYHDASGQILLKQEKYAEAIPYFKNAMDEFKQAGVSWTAPYMPLYLTECYYHTGEYALAKKYGLMSLELEELLNLSNTSVKKRASLWLSKIYHELGDISKAYEYLSMHQNIIEESEKLDELNRLADMEVKAILDDSQKEIDKLEERRLLSEQKSRIQRLWIFSITGALLSALILAFILFKNNLNKQRANSLLSRQKKEIQSTLEKLKSTQNQLIQSEKMASLGELTAGIAHEIQNPLNFVNNFSDVNSELLDELHEEARQKNLEEVIAIAMIIKENEEKIMHHGKRAESIVKNMLQHSRSSNGAKEPMPTNLNNLADEYLRLSYHGIRAKDKSFNADYKLFPDNNLPLMNVIPEDLGRVLLNLINNAFYAVRADHIQKPQVCVSTKNLIDQVQIKVKDNGSGIPEEIKDKIFQPFFTTKPAGAGTGLGLSLSYDIMKSHGGTIEVSSSKEEGTEFTIVIPKKTQI